MGHAAKDKKRDALDVYAVSTAYERMRELMDQNRGKEAEGRGKGNGPDQHWLPIRMPDREGPSTEAEGNQEKDDEQAPVNEDINACDAADAKSTIHKSNLLSELVIKREYILIFFNRMFRASILPSSFIDFEAPGLIFVWIAGTYVAHNR
jgi:hypothetical protein